MIALTFEGTKTQRASDRRYRRKGASQSIDKRRLPVADPGRRFRLCLYRIRAARKAPLFNGPTCLPSAAASLLADLSPDEPA